ncbi:MAG: Ger(x)C family spore germination protein [Veillonellales bacterium]
MYCRIIASLLLICMATLSLGCFGSRETDEVAYVLAIGIDKSDEAGMINVTYQIAIPRTLAGGPAAGAKSEKDVIDVTIKAPSLAEARSLLNSVESRAANLSHNKIFIFGEEYAREGIGDVLGPLLRFREFRGSMFIMVVKDDTAKNYINKNKPKLEALPSRFYESMFLTSGETSYYLQTFLHDFYTRLKSGGASPITALGGIYSDSSPVEPATPPNPPGKANEYTGSLPRQREEDNPAELIGTALFKQDKMVGTLTSNETRMLAILDNKFHKGFFVLEDPLMPNKSVHVNLRLGHGPEIKADSREGQAFITIDIFLEGEITSIPSGINYEQREYRTILEQEVSQVIRQDMLKMISKTQRLGVDPAGFGDHFRKNFATLPQFENAHWDQLYQQAEINVSVETKLRRSGLLWKTSPIM